MQCIISASHNFISGTVDTKLNVTSVLYGYYQHNTVVVVIWMHASSLGK